MKKIIPYEDDREEVWKWKKLEGEWMIGIVGFLMFVVIIFLLMFSVIGFGFIEEIDRYGMHYYDATAGSDSMSPIICHGDLLVIMKSSHPQFDIQVGDIVVFTMPEDYSNRYKPGIAIAHRVVLITEAYGENVYWVKGDKNQEFDPWGLSGNEIDGKIVRVVSHDNGLEKFLVDWIV